MLATHPEAPPTAGARPEPTTDELEAEIVRLSCRLAAGEHDLLTKIRRFDERQAWAEQGAKSMSHWLSWRLKIGLRAAQERVRVARALPALPRVDDAMRLGQISYCQARAITRNGTAENEEPLLELAAAVSGAKLERIAGRYRRLLHKEQGAAPERFVKVWETHEGMLKFLVQVRPEEGLVLRKAIDHLLRVHAKPGTPAPERSAERRLSNEFGQLYAGASIPDEAWVLGSGSRVVDPSQPYDVHRATESTDDLNPRFTRPDALLALAEHYLDTQASQRRFVPGRYEVLIHVDAAALVKDGPERFHAELEDGTPLLRETARRLACSAPRVVLTEDARGNPLDSGRRTRAISSALQRALISRDGGCRFPGCTNWRYVDAHHIVHWSDGGETKIQNLVTLCRRHHVLVHEGGFGLSFTPEGEPRFTDPRGRTLDARPPWTLVDGGGVGYLADPISDPELGIDESSLRSEWLPTNVGDAVGGLMALAGHDYIPIWPVPAR